jgi:4-amino-4-deoxy-L-arabinose transferase-like glycosyltransferase
MIGQLAIAMVFVGLLQSIAFWSLASRWWKISLLYGALGLTYWLILLEIGTTPAALLRTMPVVTGLAFGLLFCLWLVTMKRHHHGEPG